MFVLVTPERTRPHVRASQYHSARGINQEGALKKGTLLSYLNIKKTAEAISHSNHYQVNFYLQEGIHIHLELIHVFLL